MCAEHAVYERAGFTQDDNESALRSALFDVAPRLLCWIADLDGPVGFLSATIDFSTWRARDFMHVDCLFIREGYRGRGIGLKLFEAAREEAMRRGLDELHWQTPDWNLEAARFYRRLGANESIKRRYRYQTTAH
jgi:GNAT superfamily N-acetyltransferase